MITNYLVCMPVYKMTHRVRKGFETMDIPKENILVISFDPACKELEDRAEVIITEENLGCSRAWNIALQRHHDWTFLVSSSMVYPEGFSKVVEVLEQSNEKELFFTQHSWHCNAVSQKTVEQIGYFDENFYPAYYEDTDYEMRIEIAGLHWDKVYEICATCQVDGAATLDGLRLNINALEDYFVEKWGSVWSRPNPQDPWKHPFNNPNTPLSYWEPHSIAELKAKYKLS
jgi:hypothetical protein